MCIYLEEYTVIINIILILITGSLAWYTYRLYSASQKSLKQQGKYYEATTRPFVNIVEEENSIYAVSGRKDVMTTLTYYIKNYGNSPAKYVQQKSEFLSSINCEYKTVFKEGIHTYSIFPNMTSHVHNKELPILCDDKGESYLHLAITYKDMAKNTHHSLIIIKYEFNDLHAVKGFELVESIFY